MTNYIFALGFFDGVHLGHQALLGACRRLAEQTGCRPGAVTFDLHPEQLTEGASPALLNTPQDRLRLLQQWGMEKTLLLPFDQDMRRLPWREFLELLIRQQGAAGFVCGDDYRFGYRGAGNTQLLEQFCRSRGLPFAAVAEQTLEGVRISSTHIRQLLEQGELAQANAFLGHSHILTGTVVPGKQLGRRLGIPTANLALPQALVQPRYGVYACRCHVAGEVYSAVTNIGTRPTVSGQGVTVEPWLLDYSGDLYGQQLTLEFMAFLRPERRYDSLVQLKAAIHADAEKTRALLK